MPIKPENKKLYPSDWNAISKRIRFERAGNRCEFCGAVNHQPHPVTGGMVTLTVAHMDHNPANCADDNLKALCNSCHIRYDAKLHAKHAKVTRGKRKIERVAATGQLSFIDEVQP